MIINVWMQHFGESQLTHPMFASLRRWTRQSFAPVTPEMTMPRWMKAGCQWRLRRRGADLKAG
jgi:hypothetical protein